MSARGTFIVLVGPDGTGKSTVAESIPEIVSHAHTGTWQFHWRPGLLGPLSGRKKHTHDNASDAADAAPPEEFKYGVTLSLARYLYYLVDFVLGYWLKVRPALRRGELVIGERWYYDVIAHPRRYAFRLPGWLLRAGGKLVPEPDIRILLHGEPTVIHARKPELSIEEIGSYTEALRRALPNDGRTLEIATDKTLEQSNKALQTGISGLLDKTRNSSWSVFPSRHRPRIYIGHKDTVSNALSMYQSYSTPARLVKLLFSLLPDNLAKKLLSRAPLTSMPGDTALLIEELGDKIPEMKRPFSVYIGTTDKNRKITIQLTDNLGKHNYIKAASGTTARQAIENEARGLEEVKQALPAGIFIPRVLWQKRIGEYCCLHTTGPKQRPDKKRSIHMHPQDVRFLSSMAAFHTSTLPLSASLEKLRAKQLTLQSDTHQSTIIAEALKHSASLLGDHQVLHHAAHGDYAPWNTFILENTELFIFDWEYFESCTPAFTDLLHFEYMPLKLLKKADPAYSASSLLQRASDAQANTIYDPDSIPAAVRPAYVILYLLAQLVREHDEHGDSSEYTLKTLEHVIQLTRTTKQQRKVLVSAYACEPGKGSEPGVGWNWIQQIAKNNDVWVLTRTNNKTSIEAALAEKPIQNLHFEYVDVPRWLSFWKKGQRGVRTYYYLWQFSALIKARSLHRNLAFDIGHHVTFVNDWLWTFLALMPIPYIWGPIGSHPRALDCLLSNRRARLLETAKNIIQVTMRSLDPLYWISGLRAARVVAINRQTAELFPLRLIARHRICVETAIGMEPVATDISDITRKGPLRVLFVGRFEPVKAPHLVIDAFAEYLSRPGHDARLLMIGAGHERNALEEQVRNYDIADQVEIIDWVPREQVLETMRESDIFLFPSMECGGMVVLEAMAHGLPVVCLDFGGPGTMVTDECGIRVPVANCDYDAIKRGLADGLNVLADDARRLGMSQKARQRITECYLWEHKMRFIENLYAQCLDRKALSRTTG